MFGSYYLETVAGLVALACAVLLWRYLVRGFRQTPRPALLRFEMAGELSSVIELALLVFGITYVVDGVVKALS